MKLSELKINPNNPRLIKDDKFEKLCKSIQDFPQMMVLRPIIIDESNMILGGNMRYKALKHLKYKDIPDEWVKAASELTEAQKREFIIKDNVGFGLHDWDVLANEWDAIDLENWGLDVPDFAIMPTDEELIEEEQNKNPTIKITFKDVEQLQEAENDIQELIDRKYKGAYFSVSAGEI